MKAHRPKTAALLAYAEDALSTKGRGRVERHLARCELCRRELCAIRAYDAMADAARETPMPDVDFGKMELTLASEARRISGQLETVKSRRPWIAAGLLAAAAVLAFAILRQPAETTVAEAPARPAPAEETDPAGPATPAVPPEAPRLAPVVTLAAGTAEALTGGGARSLEPGAALEEGEHVRTGEDGVVHVRLAAATAFVAEHATELVLSRAREDSVELSLERGRVASVVAPLAHGSRYVILSAGHEVEVRGTRFAVSYLDGVVGVDLAEGRVTVRTPDGQTIELTAPARWRSSGEPVQGEAEEVPSPRELTDAGDRTLVRFAHAELVRWEIDGTRIESGGEVRLRLAPGEHELRGWDLRDRLFTALVPVGSEPVYIEPGALTAEPPRVRAGHLEQREIAPVLERARPQLARCYERALRLHPEVHGRLRLRVTVGLLGDVTRVSVLGADAADTSELRQCVSTYAERWTFPPPGGPVTFEVPLSFSARLP